MTDNRYTWPVHGAVHCFRIKSRTKRSLSWPPKTPAKTRRTRAARPPFPVRPLFPAQPSLPKKVLSVRRPQFRALRRRWRIRQENARFRPHRRFLVPRRNGKWRRPPPSLGRLVVNRKSAPLLRSQAFLRRLQPAAGSRSGALRRSPRRRQPPSPLVRSLLRLPKLLLLLPLRFPAVRRLLISLGCRRVKFPWPPQPVPPLVASMPSSRSWATLPEPPLQVNQCREPLQRQACRACHPA